MINHVGKINGGFSVKLGLYSVVWKVKIIFNLKDKIIHVNTQTVINQKITHLERQTIYIYFKIAIFIFRFLEIRQILYTMKTE